MATSLAAPLVIFTPVDGVVVFATSRGTGKGKSAAIEIGTSFWYGKLGKITKATTNFLLHRLNRMNNLPAYFDELAPDQQKQLAALILQVTAGVDVARLTRSSQEKKLYTSRGMLVAAANESMQDAVTHKNDSDAQGARVLEIEIPVDALEKAKVPRELTLKARDQMLYHHYGVAQMVYGEALGKHHEAIGKMVSDKYLELFETLGLTERDRFWAAASSTILIGAAVGKSLGLFDFDIVSIEKKLIELLKRQRTNLDDTSVNADDPNVQFERLGDFLNSRKEEIIRTPEVTLPSATGANATTRTPFSEPHLVPREWVARIAKDYLLVSLTKFMKYLKLPENAGINPHRTIRVLVASGRCTKPTYRRSLAAGLNMKHAPVPERVLQIDLSHPDNARFLNVE